MVRRSGRIMAVVPLAMDVPKEYADLAENYSMRQEEGRREGETSRRKSSRKGRLRLSSTIILDDFLLDVFSLDVFSLDVFLIS